MKQGISTSGMLKWLVLDFLLVKRTKKMIQNIWNNCSQTLGKIEFLLCPTKICSLITVFLILVDDNSIFLAAQIKILEEFSLSPMHHPTHQQVLLSNYIYNSNYIFWGGIMAMYLLPNKFFKCKHLTFFLSHLIYNTNKNILEDTTLSFL